MSSQATNGSSHRGDPSRGRSTGGGDAPRYSTDADVYNEIGSQFSDSQRQYPQQGYAGRPVRADVYGLRGYTPGYGPPQQPVRPDVSQLERQRQQQLDRDRQTIANLRLREEQQRAEYERREEERRRHAERLAAQQRADRERYFPKDPKYEDESRQSRRRKPH